MIVWNNNKNLLLAFLVLLNCIAFAQEPALKQEQSILILDAFAHIGNGKTISRSAIGIREGKIDMVLSAIDARMDSSVYDTIIHLPGHHVYPAFIAPNSRLGLVEIDAVRASRDFDDVGLYNPHVRSLTAYNTTSRITPTIRTNGVLVAQVAPKGGKISGTSSIFNLDGWNWEDAVIKEDDGVHLYWPSFRNINYYKEAKKRKELKEKYDEEVKELRTFFEKARAYFDTDYHPQKDARFEAMRPVFEGNAKVYIHANYLQQITDAVYFADEHQFSMVLIGGNDAYLVADLLKDRAIPLLLRRIHSLPINQDDAIDLPYRLPKMLLDKGLLVGLENSGSMEAMGSRNLPFYAGTAVAYGLEKEAAISMLTLNTASILGIEELLGSIEVGKNATLFLSKGDALDMRTNAVVLALIDGKFLDLDNPQKQLYRRFQNKYKTAN